MRSPRWSENLCAPIRLWPSRPTAFDFCVRSANRTASTLCWWKTSGELWIAGVYARLASRSDALKVARGFIHWTTKPYQLRRDSDAPPQISLVEIDATPVEQSPVLFLEGLEPMMLALTFDIANYIRKLRFADREGAVTTPPSEGTSAKRFVEPQTRPALH